MRRGRDLGSLHPVVQETGFHQHRRDFDLAQDVKACVPHPAIEDGDAGQNRSVHRRGQCDVGRVLRIAFQPFGFGGTRMILGRSI